MLRVLKALPLTLALASLSFFATSCGTTTTQVRFVNAIPDTLDYGGGNGALDLQFNGTTQFSNIPFLNASGSTYKTVPAGSDTIKGFEAGSTTQVFSQTLSLNSGKQYTVVATGSAANGGSNVVLLTPADINTAPANGTVNFRVINASPSGPNGGRAAVDVYILPTPCVLGSTGCTAAISALAYQNTSSYVPLSFNSVGNGWQLIVTVAGNTTPIINASIGNFGSASIGAICTLVLTDQQNVQIMNTTPIVLQDLNASGCTVN
jgi:hypothetical protein